MEPRLRRRSRGRARSNPGRAAASRSVEPHCAGLWLFPSASGLRSALLRRSETTRQICCTSRRLAVLERGGAGVEIHQLPPRSDGARKPSKWGVREVSARSRVGREAWLALSLSLRGAGVRRAVLGLLRVGAVGRAFGLRLCLGRRTRARLRWSRGAAHLNFPLPRSPLVAEFAGCWSELDRPLQTDPRGSVRRASSSS